MTSIKNVDKIKKFLMELLFPSFCLGCQREGSYLCQDCKSTLEILEYNYCLCGSNPIRLIYKEGGKPKGKCGRCQNKKLTGLHSALSYKERALTRALIYQFKDKPYVKDLAKVLVEILIEHFILTKNNVKAVWQNSVLVPVPLEKNGLKNRGYNQAEELAKELSKFLKVPLITNVLLKIKETEPQKNLSALERRENLKNAFIAKNAESIRDKKIFLIDDVYTTGSTMEECALILGKAGVKEVWGITIAREG